MAGTSPTDDEAGEPELFIHLDVQGCAALLRAIQAAMGSGLGELSPETCRASGLSFSEGTRGAFGKVTITFARPFETASTLN